MHLSANKNHEDIQHLHNSFLKTQQQHRAGLPNDPISVIQNEIPEPLQTKSVKSSLGPKYERPYQEISLSNVDIDDKPKLVPQKRVIVVTSAKHSPKPLGMTCISNDIQDSSMFDIKSQPKSNNEISSLKDKLGEFSCGQSKNIKNLQEKSIGFGEEFD